MSDTGEANRARERSNGRTMDPADATRLSTNAAASVSQRWWEEALPSRADSMPLFESPTGTPASAAPPPPPPPPPAWVATADPSASPPPPGPVAAELRAAETARIQRLEQELAAARDEATALHEMLEDLPEIFEHKFRQRLHGILEQQQLLLADNRMLRDQLFALQPADAEQARPRLLLPAPDGEARASAQKPPEPLRRVLHGMRRLGRRLRSARPSGQNATAADDLSDRDDGQPRAA